MNDKQLKEVERNEAILRKELERIEDKKIVLKKSYDKTINMQLDIQQSLRDSSQSLSPEEVMEQEEIMLIFNRQSRIVADYIHVKQDTLPKIFAVTIPLYVISFVLTHVDFNLLWRYFNWANQVTAVIGLLVATRYLILKRRNYWVTFVPAMFMLYAVVVYILSQPIGFNMGLGILTYSLALVLTGILVGLFWKSGQKQLKTVHPEAFLFNDHRPINYYSSLDS